MQNNIPKVQLYDNVCKIVYKSVIRKVTINYDIKYHMILSTIFSVTWQARKKGTNGTKHIT
jgi:hypothetical protein